MVSIQHVKKRNDMSKELKDHGFALDFEDAMQQANQIYNDGTVPDISFDNDTQQDNARARVNDEINEIKRRINVLEQKQEDTQQDSREDNSNDELLDQLVHKVNEIVEAINDLEARQDQIEQQLNKQTSEKTQEPGSQTREQPKETAETTTEESKKEDETDNPATGEYEPEDVAVEDVFYSADS